MMSDSASFSSLSDLINSHLSKSSIQASGSENAADSIIRNAAIPINTKGGTVSESNLMQSPSQRFIIPSLKLSNNGSVSNVLAQQISNSLRAQEQKTLQDEEQKKDTTQEIKQKCVAKVDDDIIDLMQCLTFPHGEVIKPASPEIEDNFEPIFIDCDFVEEPVKPPSPQLPCVMDLSCVLKVKMSGKCSEGGKVICAKYRHLPGPYLRDKSFTKSNIVKFDFSTKSPDDIIKDNLKKPYRYKAYKTSE